MSFDLSEHVATRPAQPVNDRGVCAELSPQMLAMSAQVNARRASEHFEDETTHHNHAFPDLARRSRGQAKSALKDALRNLEDALAQMGDVE